MAIKMVISDIIGLNDVEQSSMSESKHNYVHQDINIQADQLGPQNNIKECYSNIDNVILQSQTK
eukprot:gnl/Chilomastix_caulleri/6209.p1 GENE.gnl/Chilomastix_caulleri/6209~~gnl/Chilomastix_caulleri/6209.p1  ORF type:complete len:64 (+),score=7.00 gnl/Chilomastix_caulleri/6209:111-302(+)